MAYRSQNYETILLNSDTLNIKIETKSQTIFSSRYLERTGINVFNTNDLMLICMSL